MLLASMALALAGRVESAVPDGLTRRELRSALHGTWADESGTRYTFAGLAPTRITAIVDFDGEVFALRDAGWYRDRYQFTYDVPSTGYVVTVEVVRLSQTGLIALWINDHQGVGLMALESKPALP